ncbi:hypothetical protein BATDEDRAFT_28603 [Batrachochytrium dendrobatidis JAM81]|uniref:Uncharacterized protein n=1 Tax=Batrachochytrium dendrobatidis (strain JAM81 / FGSC 10211) TaxID=684364 RepID=F4PEJ8_BATDJ|nr:uncharacterized protein BATDEDRAFT_28603 [Batrachochytrium dendrobatidis JAM81]EGF76387.1 hypothetical protein BATDEDRAFT_28603 [Batrachochytrium dendrobatidis JAM81]|eukprot:XP_006682980.1 hypothetical protein BATDEDRAFT_28603 [Batrachochytrium dendrobatidis JAM81]
MNTDNNSNSLAGLSISESVETLDANAQRNGCYQAIKKSRVDAELENSTIPVITTTLLGTISEDPIDTLKTHTLSIKVRNELRALRVESAEHISTIQSNFDQYKQRILGEMAELNTSRQKLDSSLTTRQPYFNLVSCVFVNVLCQCLVSKLTGNSNYICFKHNQANSIRHRPINASSSDTCWESESDSTMEKDDLFRDRRSSYTSVESCEKWRYKDGINSIDSYEQSIQCNYDQLLRSQEIRRRASDIRREHSLAAALDAQKRYRVDLYGHHS